MELFFLNTDFYLFMTRVYIAFNDFIFDNGHET